jgi:hypothetical protein
MVYNQSLICGKLPTVWKTARVVPVFKKGDASSPSNYRPIALTCVLCKVMERIIRAQMFSFLETNSLLRKDQYGFVPGRWTCLQLLTALDRWTSCNEIGVPVDVIYLDFAKAFESVVHKKQIFKLQHHGFQGNLLAWLTDFLLNRSQSVSIENVSSTYSTVRSGVPQGSVLGQPLFIIYLNDLTTVSNAVALKKFADDVKLDRPIIDDEDCKDLQLALSDIQNWANGWQLAIAPNKCNVFHIGASNNCQDYALSTGQLLPNTLVIKDLGVWFSHDLKSSTHCQHILKIGYQRAAMIKKFFTSGDRPTLMWAFKVFVRPILEYASPVCRSPHLLHDVDSIEAVQRRFTKSLQGLKNKTYEERLLILGIDSLEKRRLRADLHLTYCLLHNKLDFDFSTFFELRVENKTRFHPFKLTMPCIKKDCRKYFFAIRVVNPWNSLPGEVVCAESLHVFKRRLHSCNLSSFLRGGL